MKKTLSLLLAIMMVIGLFAGCTTNVPTESPTNSEEPLPRKLFPPSLFLPMPHPKLLLLPKNPARSP